MSRLPLLAAAFDHPNALAQAIAVLRACPIEADLRHFGLTDPAELPVGAADRALLAVHEMVLGRPLEITVACPACHELTTLPLGRADVGEHTPCSAWCGPGAGVREPTYLDLQAAAGDPDVLLARCTVGAGAGIEDVARIEGSLCGPLRSACVGCGHPLVVEVDTMTLALRALTAVVADLDLEVHLLAASYGWDLAVIESLPDERRRRLAALVAGSP